MADPILSKLQTSPGDPSASDSRTASEREGFLLDSIGIIRKIIVSRRSVPISQISDISQDVVLRLWKWKTKFHDRSSKMDPVDWKSFVARAAHNEVNRVLKHSIRLCEIPLDETDIPDPAPLSSPAETIQLVENAWQGICRISLYQRQALIFSSIDLALYLLQYGVDESELISVLGITKEHWHEIAKRMPLSDLEIAEIVRPVSQNRITAAAVKKARYDARKRLKELMK